MDSNALANGEDACDDSSDFVLTEEEFLQLRHRLALINKDKTALEHMAEELNKESDRKQELIMELRLRNATMSKSVKNLQGDAAARDGVISALHAEIAALKSQLSRRTSIRPQSSFVEDVEEASTEHEPARPPITSPQKPEAALPPDTADADRTIAALKEALRHSQEQIAEEKRRRRMAEDAVDEAVSRVRELEREAAEQAADHGPGLDLSLSQQMPSENGLTPREQRALFARVQQLVTDNDDLTEELRDVKSHLATLRSRMEIVRQQLQKRDQMYAEALNPKTDKGRRKALLEDIANSLVVSYRLLSLDEDG